MVMPLVAAFSAIMQGLLRRFRNGSGQCVPVETGMETWTDRGRQSSSLGLSDPLTLPFFDILPGK